MEADLQVLVGFSLGPHGRFGADLILPYFKVSVRDQAAHPDRIHHGRSLVHVAVAEIQKLKMLRKVVFIVKK